MQSFGYVCIRGPRPSWNREGFVGIVWFEWIWVNWSSVLCRGLMRVIAKVFFFSSVNKDCRECFFFGGMPSGLMSNMDDIWPFVAFSLSHSDMRHDICHWSVQRCVIPPLRRCVHVFCSCMYRRHNTHSNPCSPHSFTRRSKHPAWNFFKNKLFLVLLSTKQNDSIDSNAPNQ